ncbi:MAG: endonuclease/exonuclease/phosphatase family protein [Pseudomonadota bacterium]|nr:endonuclease/exonuclease/phosphatase family protein [Pseudomonadota bacterium]
MSALVQLRWLASLSLPALLGACITVTVDPRSVVSGPGGSAKVMTLTCADAERALGDPAAGTAADMLDGRPFRLLSWNIHKQGDPGWDRDLAALTESSDIVLIQEAVLQPPLRRIFDQAGLRWIMASSFMSETDEFGVLTATRVAPIASCTQRAAEPVILIPKSSAITWLRIAGTREALAIVNVHAINFELLPIAFRAQIEALADTLAGHRGPIIFGGDFNTWSDARDAVLHESVLRLGLTELELQVDRRALFFGRHLDHVFVRGLEPLEASAVPVTSSDHNPLAATLRIP